MRSHATILTPDGPVDGYSGHSFRKGAARHTHDSGIFDDQIQVLKKWTYGAITVYFATNERFSFVQARSPVSDRPAGPPSSAGSTTVPSTILIWRGSFGPYLTLQSKTAVIGDPLWPNYIFLACLDRMRSSIESNKGLRGEG
jgi:hypothetical protein